MLGQPPLREGKRKGVVGTDGILVSDRPAGFVDPKTGAYF
jgi:hypothetical protein